MYAEYRECTRSTGSHKLYSGVQAFMSYDKELPQPDDDLFDVTESLQPYISICDHVSVYIVLVELIIPGGLENLHSTAKG